MGDHKSHIRHEDTLHVEGPYDIYSIYGGSIWTCWGTIQYLFHIRYGGPYFTVTFKSVLKNHIVHVGGPSDHTCEGPSDIYSI